MNRIRIAQIVTDLDAGGVEKFLVDLVTYQNRQKFEHTVIVLGDEKNSFFERKLCDENIKVIFCNTSKVFFDFRTMLKVYKILKQIAPDIVHVHTYVLKMVLLPIIAAKIPYRFHTLHLPIFVEERVCSKLVMKQAYSSFGNFVPISVSKQVKNELEKAYELVATPFVYNGIDLAKYVPFELSKDAAAPFRFIMIARFVPEKNHPLLIKAFKEVTNVIPNVELCLVGIGKEQKSIKELATQLGLLNCVSFLNEREDIPELLNRSDAFVLTSRFEGFGLVLVEAMACGVPVISTDVGAVSEIIDHKKDGLLIEDNNITGLSTAMIEIIQNSELRETLRKNALEKVKNYSLEKMVVSYEKIFEGQFLEKD